METVILWQSSRSGWWFWLAGWPSSLLRWWTFYSTKSILHLSTLTQRDSKKSALFTILEEKKSSLGRKKVFSNISVLFPQTTYTIFIDKRDDPEDLDVRFTRNKKTSVDDTTEEQRVLLEIPQQEQSWLCFCLLFRQVYCLI